jgi:uridylate kinase
MNVLLRNDVAARLGDNDHVMVSNASTAPGRSTDAAAAARHPPVDSNDDVR